MAQAPLPPPPSSGGYPSGGQRPGLVTAAAVLLFIGGGLGVVAGLLFTFAAESFGGSSSGIVVVLGLITLAISALEIYAGVQILALKESGRRLGLILAAVGAALALLALLGGTGQQIISLAINGFVVYALATTKEYFR